MKNITVAGKKSVGIVVLPKKEKEDFANDETEEVKNGLSEETD